MNIIIFGPQGSGKGTQARLLAKKTGNFYFESGVFSREIASRDPYIDKLINKKGKLIPDRKMFEHLKRYLEDKKVDLSNVIFEGYPRSIEQYELLNNYLKKKGKKIDLAIYLKISEKETVRRLSERRVCRKCGEIYNLMTNPPKGKKCKCGGELVQREDDKPGPIRKRLELYKKNTEPLIDTFRKEGILVEIDGERPIEVIAKDLQTLLKK